MKKKIAVTGGIGCGKSTVLQYIKEMGYPVFSCDEIYGKIIQTPAYIEKIGSIFPDCIENEKLNRKRLGEIIFQSESKRKQLNAIAHPMIMDVLLKAMENATSSYVFAEVPLLFENGYENLFDNVIVVTRNIEDRVFALIQRDCATKVEIQRRIKAQYDYDAEENRSYLKQIHAIILENNSSQIELKNDLKNIVDSLKDS